MAICLLFLCYLQDFAQRELLTNQQHYGVDEGLPQSFISGITQDKDGFIWLATPDGLCRFDGRNFKTIKFHPNEPAGLAANSVYLLGLPVNNILPVYYSTLQADYFDMRTFKATRNNILPVLAKIPNARWGYYSRNTHLSDWLFMNAEFKGVGWIETAGEKTFLANRSNGMLQQDTVHTMIQSPAGRLYLVSEDGVQVSDTGRKQFSMVRFNTHLKQRSQSPGISGETSSYCIGFFGSNNLAALDGNTIVLLDISKGTSRVINLPQPPDARAGRNELLQTDSEGRPYFATNGSIFRLEKNGQLRLLWENKLRPELRINTMFIDRSDVLWLSVDAQGLTKVDLRAPRFRSFTYSINFITDILTQAFGKNPGLPNAWNNTDAAYYFRQVRDSKGNLYVAGNWEGLHQVWRLNDQGLQSMQGLQVSTGHSALVCLPGDIITTFSQEEAAWYSWKDAESQPARMVLGLASMKGVELADAAYVGGYTWLSTYNHGLLQYQGTKRINQFKDSIANVVMPFALTEICPDPLDSNKFWIGSRGGGMILWDVKKGVRHVYTMEDGLPNNTVYCILPDKLGNIWCSTNKGIFRMNVTTKQLTVFEKTDGLPGNEFNRAHKFAFADGKLCFGGLDGYTIFNPADFDATRKKETVPVMLTGFQINNQPQNIDIPGSIIRHSLNDLDAIDLRYDENYLRFEFAAMLFNQPQKTKYRYRLEGVDKEWIENGNSNLANYAALGAGSYRLRLSATDINGAWSDAEKILTIRIRPPFWASWWAYLIYISLLVVAARQYFVYREKRIRAAQSLAFEKREALRLREMDEQKDRFFSNITHEFRTPLTLIISPLEKLVKNDSLPTPVVNTLKTAQRNSQQLLRLINEFLDFSKLNDGQLKLKLSIGELELFVSTCVESFAVAAAEKNLGLGFSSQGVSGFYFFDEEKWEKILANLLCNALKFTPAGGNITVTLTGLPDNMIRLAVTDTGPGIPENQQAKIFDRFYQVEDSAIRNFGGTGIGLALVKELTTLMNGQVSVSSKCGGPTEFLITVPVTRAPAAVTAAPDQAALPSQINSSHATEPESLPLVLIAEDNDELRSFLVESMAANYRCLEAANGLIARDQILQELPDIVISDVMMPGMDGFDLCRQCKTDNRTAHIGFILLTSKAAHEAKLKGLQNGADDYITKPFNVEELALRTTNLLQLQQTIRAQLRAQVLPLTPAGKPPVIDNPFLQQLYTEIDLKIDDTALGVEYLCKAMGMSRSTLNRKLQSLLGTPPNEMIKQYRLQKATGYLSEGLDISSAAYKVGFSSPSYFAQCFKEQYNITPSDWVSSRK